jgi:hypothetical protein
VLFALSAALAASFCVIERRASAPLIPRRIAGSRRLLAANVGLGATNASIYGMAFILSLYGQQVLGWSALELGYAACALPASVAIGAGVGQALVTRRGPRGVTIFAMAGLAGGLALLSGLPVHTDYLGHMLPALVVFGLAYGAAVTSYSIATLSGVQPGDAGLASGLNNTFESIFGALGTAALASVAITRTHTLLHQGSHALNALNDGFQLALTIAIVFPALATLASLMLGRDKPVAAIVPGAPASVLDSPTDLELA